MKYYSIPLHRIEDRPGFRDPLKPRRSLEQLTNDIASRGITYPITVRKTDVVEVIDGFRPIKFPVYEVVIGQRRVNASRLLGRKCIPAYVKEYADPVAYKTEAIVANFRDTSPPHPLDAMYAYAALIDLGFSVDELPGLTGQDRGTIARGYSLLNLDVDLVRLLVEERISVEVASILSTKSRAAQALYASAIVSQKRKVLAPRQVGHARVFIEKRYAPTGVKL